MDQTGVSPLLARDKVVISPVDAMDDAPTDDTGSHGLNIDALAAELGLVTMCPVCLSGRLKAVVWAGPTPVRQDFLCGHESAPRKAGRHRKTAKHHSGA
jgi:hypothetical protein